MRLILILILLFTYSNVFTQNKLSLNDCLEYAYEHNPEILEYSNNINKSSLNLKQTKLNLLPSVNAEYNHYLSSGRSLNIETYSWDNEDIQQGDIAIVADLIIFNGLYNLYNRETAQINIDKSKLALQQKKLLTSLEITKLFYNVALTNTSITILKQTNSITAKEIEKLKMQISEGTKAQGSIYELQAQFQKEKLEIHELLNEKEKHILNLSNLLNWQEKNDLNLNFNKLSSINSSFDNGSILPNNIINKSVITSISIKELNLADKAIKIKKSYLYPTLSAEGALSSWHQKGATNLVDTESNYSYFNQMDNNLYKQLTLTLSIPIFNKRQVSSDIKLLQIDYENTKLQLENTKNKLYTELKSIQVDIQHLEQKIEQISMMSGTYQKSYDVAMEKYHSGLLDAYSLNTSKNNYTTSLLQQNKLQIELTMNIELLMLYEKFSE